MKFWKKKDKKSKSAGDKETKTSNDEISAQSDTKDKETRELDKTLTSQEKTILKAVGAEEETKPLEIEETTEAEKTTQYKYDDYDQSGVFIFGCKIEGRFQKIFLTILAITLIPPTFLFSIALLICVCSLLFPLVTIIMIAFFPATIFSFFILMAALPVMFPAILIFLLITSKGKLSAFAEGKLLILKLYRWTLPTI